MAQDNVMAVIRQVNGFDHPGIHSEQPQEREIVLRFSDNPLKPDSYTFGTGRTDHVDFRFQGPGISSQQFTISFHWSSRRLQIRGLSATTKMIISYDDGGICPRGLFTWLLNGLDPFVPKKHISVTINDIRYFYIDVKHEDVLSGSYISQVERFLNRRLHSPPGIPPTNTRHLTESKPGRENTAGTEPTQEKERPIRRLRYLDSGGFSKVQLTLDVSTGFIAVIKEPSLETKEDEDLMKRWKNEAALLKKAQHNDGNTGHRMYLEYAPEGSLFGKVFPKDDTLEIFMQCLDALRHIHEELEEPIIHRDLKPSNILLMRTEPKILVKLCDFGLSEDKDRLVTKCGTDGFQPPEFFDPARQSSSTSSDDSFTAAMDIWSLGITGLALLGHQRSFRNHNSDAAAFEYCLPCVRDVDDLAAEDAQSPLMQVLQRMLVINPDERWTARQCYEFLKPHALGSHSILPGESNDDGATDNSQSTIQGPNAVHAGTSESADSQATEKGRITQPSVAEQTRKRSLSPVASIGGFSSPSKRRNLQADSEYPIVQVHQVVVPESDFRG